MTKNIQSMKLNSTRKIIIAICLLGVSLLAGNQVSTLWFKWRLSKNFNAPTIDSEKERANRLCLIFALDGVPYEVVEDLYKQGYFKGFYPPGQLISTYPSLTRPAFSKMLIGGKPYGYERLYFDTGKNERLGNTLAQKIFTTNENAKDYNPKLHFLGFPGYIAYVFPDQFTQTAIDTFKQRLLEFKGNEFIAYMGFSDAIAHVQGRYAQAEYLKMISHILDEVRNELGIPLDVVLFSDHGNNFKQNTRVDLAAELEKAGLNDAEQLKGPDDFVLMRNGFVSIAAIYCFPDRAEYISEILSRVDGVDFSTYTNNGSILVNGKNTTARIRRRGSSFEYKPINGDPLLLSEIIKNLRIKKRSSDQTFFNMEDWWRVTKNHIYPNPLERIWQGHFDLVQFPSTIIVSFKDGYAFGPAIFNQQIIAGRKSTHGALLASHSYGFLMTDFKTVNTYNRPQDVAKLLENSFLMKKNGMKPSLSGTE